MGTDESDSSSGTDDKEKTFKDRIEEMREKQAENEEHGRRGSTRPFDETMGSNPFAQMMGGMMGGGFGPMAGHGPMGNQPADIEPDRIARELEMLRLEVREISQHLDRIATSLEE